VSSLLGKRFQVLLLPQLANRHASKHPLANVLIAFCKHGIKAAFYCPDEDLHRDVMITLIRKELKGGAEGSGGAAVTGHFEFSAVAGEQGAYAPFRRLDFGQ
jgi:hypothetical protein